MLESFMTLRTRIDRFSASIRARYSEQITCRPGCLDCCEAGLTVVMIEGIAIGTALGLDEERIQLQAGQSSLQKEGGCAFLDKKGLCSIYANRPLVCRTHGLPLKYEEQDGISICKKNFIYQVPHNSAVFNMDNLHAALFAVNVNYCRKTGLNPLARVAMDRIASLLTG